LETVVVPLLERQTQLATLAEYAGDAKRGDGRLVLISGEAGVGKSALVEQLQLDGPDATWCWGACDGLCTPRPLGPLFDIAGALGGALLELCRASAPRDELFTALLRQVSETGEPHVLVMEDIHWADEATIDLLRFLGRRIRDARVLLIATYRDEGLAATDPLRTALGDLATQRPVRRIHLPPLSAAAVAVLASGSCLDPAELYRLTGGNPFYVTEVLQAGMSEVPGSARDAVLARAARLSPQPRTVLDSAALIGGQVDIDLLRSVTGCLAPAIDELLESGLLAGEGTALRFRHEIARLAVEEAVTAHRRAGIHTRILSALRALGRDDDARLAFHAEAAGDGQAALRHAAAAARRAAGLGSHREAAVQFERALRFADRAEPSSVASLYDGFAYEASLLDRWQEAADARAQAIVAWRATGDRQREGDSLRWFASSQCALGRGDEAVAAARAAVALLEPLGATIELAWAYASLAGKQMLRCANSEAIELSQRAQAVARRLDLSEVLSDALNTEACAVRATGQDWAGLLRTALAVALNGQHEAQAGRAYANLYSCHIGDWNVAVAEQNFADGIAYCDSRDLATYSIFMRSERTSALERTGRWHEAAASCTELLSAGGPSPAIRVGPLGRLGIICARRGGPGAWECLDQAIELANGTGDPLSVVAVRLARSEAYWLAGQLADARREAELADDVARVCGGWERGAVAVWLRRTGSTRPPGRELAVPCQRYLDGEWAKSARLWIELGCRYEAGLALLGSAGEASLRQALRIFTDLGATAAARLARRKMRQFAIRSIPVGPRSATRGHPLGLTRREHEVLDLICAGHTNAEIAGKLFISVKTTGNHVSAVLAKLQAPTRRAAAAQAAQLDLRQPAPAPADY
jgi:DNA-binding CsgD family transcriptional regulator